MQRPHGLGHPLQARAVREQACGGDIAGIGVDVYGLVHQRIPAATAHRQIAVGIVGQADKTLVGSPGIRALAWRIAVSRLIIGAGEPSALSGTLSRGTTAVTGSVEIEIWLSNKNAWIRNPVLVMEITAMNQIDQMPLRRWKSPQKMRAP